MYIFTIERREVFWTVKMSFVLIAGRAIVSFPKYQWTAPEGVPNVFIQSFRKMSCNGKRRRCCGDSIRERYSDKPHMKITLEGSLARVIFCL